jgi:hypothetical protein
VVGARLAAIPEVLEVHTITGAGDMWTRVVARSNADLQRAIDQEFRLEGTDRSTTVTAPATQMLYTGAEVRSGKPPADQLPPGELGDHGRRAPVLSSLQTCGRYKPRVEHRGSVGETLDDRGPAPSGRRRRPDRHGRSSSTLCQVDPRE